MREIKFRAWFPNKKGMRFVAMNEVYEGNKSYLYLSPMPMSDYEPIELMQYTGLKDKNGKEIYEGDILKGKYRLNKKVESLNYKVIFNESGYWDAESLDEKKKFKMCYAGFEKAEVIGNIYENPGLLEVNDE